MICAHTGKQDDLKSTRHSHLPHNDQGTATQHTTVVTSQTVAAHIAVITSHSHHIAVNSPQSLHRSHHSRSQPEPQSSNLTSQSSQLTMSSHSHHITVISPQSSHRSHQSQQDVTVTISHITLITAHSTVITSSHIAVISPRQSLGLRHSITQSPSKRSFHHHPTKLCCHHEPHGHQYHLHHHKHLPLGPFLPHSLSSPLTSPCSSSQCHHPH